MVYLHGYTNQYKAFPRIISPEYSRYCRQYPPMRQISKPLYKHALISPVPKVNDPMNLVTDFRQISVIPQVAKVLEKIQLLLNQHAFMKGEIHSQHINQQYSRLVQCHRSRQSIQWCKCAVYRKGKRRKAFDLVDHDILLTKLGNIRVSKSFWLWCKSFLTRNRTQQVKFLYALSIQSGSNISWCPSKCGFLPYVI